MSTYPQAQSCVRRDSNVCTIPLVHVLHVFQVFGCSVDDMVEDLEQVSAFTCISQLTSSSHFSALSLFLGRRGRNCQGFFRKQWRFTSGEDQYDHSCWCEYRGHCMVCLMTLYRITRSTCFSIAWRWWLKRTTRRRSFPRSLEGTDVHVVSNHTLIVDPWPL